MCFASLLFRMSRRAGVALLAICLGFGVVSAAGDTNVAAAGGAPDASPAPSDLPCVFPPVAAAAGTGGVSEGVAGAPGGVVAQLVLLAWTRTQRRLLLREGEFLRVAVDPLALRLRPPALNFLKQLAPLAAPGTVTARWPPARRLGPAPRRCTSKPVTCRPTSRFRTSM
eukprot:GHVT01059419.1.p2 GENE.GHVT01059419.1~~GHVT01059419.1.p2  ORF type:complete len:169 (+),score=31.57 GHVT01059419.1:362-868(+)